MIIEEDLRGIEETCYSSPAHRLASALSKGADTVIITVEKSVLPVDVVEMVAEMQDYRIESVETVGEGEVRITMKKVA